MYQNNFKIFSRCRTLNTNLKLFANQNIKLIKPSYSENNKNSLVSITVGKKTLSFSLQQNKLNSALKGIHGYDVFKQKLISICSEIENQSLNNKIINRNLTMECSSNNNKIKKSFSVNFNSSLNKNIKSKDNKNIINYVCINNNNNNITTNKKSLETNKYRKLFLNSNIINKQTIKNSDTISPFLFFNSKKENTNNISFNNSSNIKIMDHDFLNNENIFMLPYLFCPICDVRRPTNQFLKLNCGHFLCFGCTKKYYEDQIEMGIIQLKCPFNKCSKYLENYEILKNHISNTHLSRILKPEENDNSKNNLIVLVNKPGLSFSFNNKTNCTVKTTIEGKNNSSFSKNIDKNKYDNLINKYAKTHVIEIKNNLDDYILYNFFKDIVCPCCHLPCLFGKISPRWMKCLNCFKKICKFCLKEVPNNPIEHFNKLENNCCKYYRFNSKKKTQMKIKNFSTVKYQIIYYIGTFVILIVFFYRFFFDMINKILKYQFYYPKDEIKNEAGLINFTYTVLDKKKKKSLMANIMCFILNIFCKIIIGIIISFGILVGYVYYPCFITVAEIVCSYAK